MFEFLFKYPAAAFARGELVLLGNWPKWILDLLIVAAAAGLAVLLRAKFPKAVPTLQNWRMAMLWLMQTALAVLLLTLLWHPALMVSELKPQQNIIAVVVDDSRSMGITEAAARDRRRRPRRFRAACSRISKSDSRLGSIAWIAG